MTSLAGDAGVEAASDALHVQLDNARNFINTLQQIAWALSLRIKGLGSSDSNTSTVSDINEETKCSSLSKTNLMMQLRKITLIMEQMQMKMEQGLEVYSSSKKFGRAKATSVSDKPNDAEVPEDHQTSCSSN